MCGNNLNICDFLLSLSLGNCRMEFLITSYMTVSCTNMNINKRTWKAFCRHQRCCCHFNNFMLNAQFTFYVRHKYFPSWHFLLSLCSALNLSYSLPHISYYIRMRRANAKEGEGGGRIFCPQIWIHRVSSVFMHNPKLNKEGKKSF